MTFFQEVMALRRRASEFAGVWKAVGDQVYAEDGARVARLMSTGAADHIVAMHNTWLKMANAWLMTARALRDRRLVAEAQERDKHV
jgi:hypothetical protein